MGHQIISAIVCFVVVANLYFGNCQDGPRLDWQFDPYSTDQWFKQKLDHYDSSNVQHWPQRYVTSYRFYRLGGPIFVFLSGPGPELTLTDIESGAIAEYAEEQGAFVIGFEHRFYGKSQPTPDLSTENLHFLTIPQTIEDIAAFIRSWRARDEFRNSKWVLFGASYLGSLAAWFSQKHPELIDAFVASSAPLELRYEIPEFLENVGIILNGTSPKCYETVAEGFSCLAKIFNEEDCQNYTLSDVKDKFDFCSELDRTRPLDATGVFAELFSTINAVVMYHDPSPDSFPDTNLDRFCKYVTVESDEMDALDKIGKRVKEINKHRGVPCAEFRFQTTVDFLKEKSWDSPAAEEGYRQLQWQLCNELGWTVASANISQPFGNYLTPFLHSEICQNLFGLTETEMRLKVLKANTDLKGKNLNTKCGIYVNGDKDPWHTFSITTAEEAGQCNRAILIEGGSHARDVEDFSNTPSYPPQVSKAQRKVSQYLDSWMKTGNCCDEDASESKRVISTHARPARAPNPKEYYYAFSNLLKQPNVQVKPHSYPVDNQGQLFTSPTAIPYQVSTTDVLSVSPRIPVVESLGNPEPIKQTVDESMYRDPRNTEFRRYRVVKLLRHRRPFAPTTPEPSMAPSMEQFEADFPEHSLRVEGRVERVFKNGTVMNVTDSPSTEEANAQLDLFDKGRKLLMPPISSNEVTPLPYMERGNSEKLDKKGRFRYVVKQVFKDVMGVENTNNATQYEEPALNSKETNTEKSLESLKQEMDKNVEISNGPKKTAKRQQSLENVDIESFQQQGRKTDFASSSSSSDEGSDSDSLSTSSSEQQSSIEELNSKPQLSKGITARKSSALPVQKRESGEASSSTSDESSEGDSISTSESVEHFTIKQPRTSGNKSNDIMVRVSRKESKKSSGKENDKKNDKVDNNEDDYDDDYYDDDDDYYDDDDDDESDESDEDDDRKGVKSKSKENKVSGKANDKTTNKDAVTAKSVRSKSDNISTEFSSGEDTRPKRLREKISEKIMSSSETVEGDQKSKEKTKTSNHRQKGKSQINSNGSIDDDEESLEDTEASRSASHESSSGEDYNYSLEPSGSNPKGSFRKKQLAPLTKPVVEEPGTVINVEISGSYPKRSHRRKMEKKKETVRNDDSSEVSETQTEKPKRRRNHRRKKVKTTTEEIRAQEQDTTTTTTATTTTTSSPDFIESPPTNSYATWNRGKALNALPVQQESPTVINLSSGDSDDSLNSDVNVESTTPNPNNNVMYIIIGDIPREDNPNMIDDNPSHEALFNFIQKLVNRHSPGLFPVQQIQESQSVPTPPPTTTSTTTTTMQPPIVSDRRYFDHNGKYLLIRPVQVVSLGREHVVHSQDLKNESLIDLMTMETPSQPYSYESPAQNMKRQYNDPVGGYRFKSPLHRDHFERLLSVDGQVRDSDRDNEYYRRNFRRLDQIPDPSWRSIRGISQFGPVIPPQRNNNNNPVSSLLGLTAADTMWVSEGVPFLPRNRPVSSRSHHHNFN